MFHYIYNREQSRVCVLILENWVLHYHCGKFFKKMGRILFHFLIQLGNGYDKNKEIRRSLQSEKYWEDEIMDSGIVVITKGDFLR